MAKHRVHRLFFESAPEAIFVAASDHKIIAANGRAAEIVGRKRTELLGTDLLLLFSSADCVRQRLGSECLRLERVEGLVCDLLRNDRAAVPVELAARLLEDGSIAVTLRPGTATSESDHRDVHRWASREEMQSILSTIPYFVIRVGLDGIIQFANRTGPGVRMEEVLGSHVSSWIHPDDHGAFQKVFAEVVTTGKPGALETRGSTSARARYFTRIGPVIEDGAVTSLIVLGEDVTDRKRIEEELRVSSQEIVKAGERFRSVIEASPVPFALNDDRQNITYLNPEFVRTFGYTLADIPTLCDWWPRAYPDPAYRDQVASEWVRRLDAARLGGEAFEPMEIEICAKDGSRRNVIASAASLTEAFAGEHLVVLYDVTKAKQLEIERRKLEERLAHIQRMQSIGRLAGGVAHDNNNMLSVIMSHADIALRHIDPSHVVREDLIAIRQATQRSANLTRQLLAHARQQPITPIVIDVGNAVTREVSLLHRLLEENISLTVHVDPAVGRVRIDPTQIQQILTNLCLNARDSIGGSGGIVITVEDVVWSEAEARAHGASTPGDYVLLSVKDDGCGMPPEILEHVFEPFFTTKPVGEGTGLGLATVLGIVEQNGGFILVDSAPSRGSTFRVYLPKYHPVADAVKAPKSARAPKQHQQTLLIVEDEEALLRVLKAHLEVLGYTVLATSNPLEALSIAQNHRGHIDLLITDVIMPQMNGRALALELEKRRPGIESLYISGYTADIIAKRGMLEEGLHFLQKPFTPAELDETIRTICSGSATKPARVVE